MKLISVVTPCFNEEDNVRLCAEAVQKIFEMELPEYQFEHIFADNASTDGTRLEITNLASVDSRIKMIVNSRNVGPFRNMWNALKHARGDAIIPFLPADLQDPVEVIPKMVRAWESGDMVVYGVRINRQESWLLRFYRRTYYKIIAKFAEATIPENAGEFLLADKRVVDSILSVDDQYPYIRGLIAQTAVRSSKIQYTWVKRKHGKSKLNFVHLVDQAINGLVSTSRIPARLALLAGFFLAGLGILGGLITILLVLFSNQHITPGIPTIIVSIFVFCGVQLLFLGIIGEYVLSIHGQVRKTPPMFEIELLNIDNKQSEN